MVRDNHWSFIARVVYDTRSEIVASSYPSCVVATAEAVRCRLSVTAVVFVIQHLFDEAQITADNVGAPVHRDQWHYIHNLGLDMKNTLSNVS